MESAIETSFRILALDGGGIRGAFTAAVLSELEKVTELKVVDHFDLITGTSTGGIIAIGLGLGKTPKELLDLYVKNGAEIFGNQGFLSSKFRGVRHFFGPKHSQKNLRCVLQRHFGERRLGESKVRLVIPTFDASKGSACTFKTAHHARLVNEYMMSAVDVAVATAAAPTFFEAARIKERPGELYIDGGVWANNPVLVGVVEAVHFLGKPLDAIEVLSIGTTESFVEFSGHRSSGIVGWGVGGGLVDLFMAGQVSSSLSQARLLLGDRLHRINFKGKEFKLDNSSASAIQTLQGLGHSVGRDRKHVDVVRERFLNGRRAAPFIPYKEIDLTASS